jgi:hemolysin activation/secretion protein
VRAFPALWGLTSSFTTSTANGTVYVPLMENGLHLALRAGGAIATGDAPVQYAPTLGGWSTLRGYASRRYTGDRALDGATELHVPAGTVTLFMRWDLDVFALADAGRVWFDGDSDGTWHTGYGGGLALSALGKSVSVAYARGESNRFYLKLGAF